MKPKKIGNLLSVFSLSTLIVCLLMLISFHQYHTQVVESYTKNKSIFAFFEQIQTKDSFVNYCKQEGLKNLNEIDSDSAATILLGQNSEEINSILGENPLPVLVKVSVPMDKNSMSLVKNFKTKFPNGSFSSNEEDIQVIIEPLNLLIKLLGIIVPILLLISILSTILANRNLLNLDKSKIKIMQMIGSRPFYIVKKYLVSTAINIVISFFLGVLFYFLILGYLETDFPIKLVNIYSENMLVYTTSGILFLVFIIFLTSFLSIKETLRLKMEEIF